MMRRILGYAFLTLLVVLGLFFGQLNAQRVTLDLYYLTLELPLAVIVMGAVVVGVLLGALIVLFSTVLPLKSRARRLNRRLAKSAGPADPGRPGDG